MFWSHKSVTNAIGKEEARKLGDLFSQLAEAMEEAETRSDKEVVCIWDQAMSILLPSDSMGRTITYRIRKDTHDDQNEQEV